MEVQPMELGTVAPDDAPDDLVNLTTRTVGALGTNGVVGLCGYASWLLAAQLDRHGLDAGVNLCVYDNSDSAHQPGRFEHSYVRSGEWICDPTRRQFEPEAMLVFRLDSEDARRHDTPSRFAKPGMEDMPASDFDLIDTLAEAIRGDTFTAEEGPDILTFCELPELIGALQRRVADSPSDLCMACDERRIVTTSLSNPDHPGETWIRQACARHALEVAKVDPSNFGRGNPDVVWSTPERNEPCWCGSGLKYKRCHGK
jgi:SEC-C motif-containing protein